MDDDVRDILKMVLAALLFEIIKKTIELFKASNQDKK